MHAIGLVPALQGLDLVSCTALCQQHEREAAFGMMASGLTRSASKPGQGGARTERRGQAEQARGRDVVQALQRVHMQALAVDEQLHQRQARRLRRAPERARPQPLTGLLRGRWLRPGA